MTIAIFSLVILLGMFVLCQITEQSIEYDEANDPKLNTIRHKIIRRLHHWICDEEKTHA